MMLKFLFAYQTSFLDIKGTEFTSSYTECENLCAKFDNCRSYQISGQKKKCQLLKRTAGTWAKKMTPKKGWAYREKVS